MPTIATPLQFQHRRNIGNLPHLKGLKLAHPVQEGNFNIDLLIGADSYWDIVQDKIIRGEMGPTAVQSKLGYLLSGPTGIKHTYANVTNVFHVSTRAEESDLECFWTVESLGIAQENPPAKNFLSDYQSTSITCDSDGSYIAGFPWKDDHPALPNNLKICEKRTRATARRLHHNPDLLRCYREIINEQESRGFIEKVTNPDPKASVHYIPHHPVTKESPTTPVRIVYDCSCRETPTSPSPNDCLATGPPSLPEIGSILVRFRSHPIGLSTDIEKAFLHVKLKESDRDVTRFLWLSNPVDPESEFQMYRFKSVLFGAASSPFMLNAVLHTHLESCTTKVTQDMKDNLYVDNIITGCDSVNEAFDYYEESREVMAEAGFNLRSWATNSKLLKEQAAKDKVLDADSPIANVLGLRWNTVSDTLSLVQKSPPPTDSGVVTKREILKESSKIFDPLGLISPVSVKAKILMQEVWQQNLDWDEPVSQDIRERWLRIANDLIQSINITIPRSYFSPNCSPGPVQLHVFADASPKAYGAVAYVTQAENVSFVMSKSRVAPLKKLSLPRLELMAALIGARLADFLVNALKERLPHLHVILWSDSQIVLYWLNSDKQLPQFVHNRVAEIKHFFAETHWNYCPTADNPADHLTRGLTTIQLQSCPTWLQGPIWLTVEQDWPQWETNTALLVELQNGKILETAGSDSENEKLTQPTATTTPPLPSDDVNTQTINFRVGEVVDTSKYSTYSKALRVTAYVFRFIQNIKHRSDQRKGPLTVLELATAEKHLICARQQAIYNLESEDLRAKRKLKPRSSLIRQLRLFIDKDGLIRCGGRIHNAPIPKATKFPILLPKNDYLTNLIIRDIHA